MKDVQALVASDVRVLTVAQPWAWCIASGAKQVENRSWKTRWRGTLLIHAGQRASERGFRDERVADLMDERRCSARWPGAKPYDVYGAVVATAELVDLHPDVGCCRPWGESLYTDASGSVVRLIHHWVLADIEPLREPVEAKGRLGLWTPTRDLLAEVSEQHRG